MKKWSWLAAVVVIADQLVKWLSSSLRTEVTLIPGVLRFTYAENTGMAFSLFSGQSWLLGVISVAAVVIGWLVLRGFRLGPVSRCAPSAGIPQAENRHTPPCNPLQEGAR